MAAVLAGSPGPTALTTSRRPLRLRGEHEYPVSPLPLPDPEPKPDAASIAGNDAIRLFVDRARAVRPDFALTQDNAAAVADIARRLEGLSLAIELAAARVRLLSPGGHRRTARAIPPSAAGGASDLSERQRTIRDTIEWSCDLLDAAETTLFRRPAVFVGGWTIGAAEEVCTVDEAEGGFIVELLDALVSQNLIRVVDAARGGLSFAMLETIREYAQEQLMASGEKVELFSRHAAFAVGIAETAEPYLRSGQRDPWLARLDTEIDNARPVLKRSLAGEVGVKWGLRLAGASGWFWHLRRYLSEGREGAAALLALPDSAGRTARRARLLFPAGGLAWSQGTIAPQSLPWTRAQPSSSSLVTCGD